MKRAVTFLALGIAAIAASTTLPAQEAEHNHAITSSATPHPAGAATVHDSKLTYTKDIAPLFAKNCENCHRPGEGTPFSMTNYNAVKPWATSIKRAVAAQRMPPWFEDGTTKKFENYRGLAKTDIDKIVQWVDAGAPMGEPKDLPKPREFVQGWSIPKPDLALKLPKPFAIPAKGLLEYQYVILPTGLTKDTWVQYIEAAPTDRSVVHHIVAYVRTPGSSYFKNMPYNTFFTAKEASKFPDKHPDMVPDMGKEQDKEAASVPSDWLVGYAPGQTPDMYKNGQAKLVPAGSDIVLELHYMPNGKAATTDQASLGMVFAKGPVTQRAMTLSANNDKFKIPPHDPNYKVDASYTMPEDMVLVGMHPHMHLRGKSAQYRIVFPDGTRDTLLNVPNFTWRWQLWYDLAEPIKMPKGTKIECTEHFDNSKGNPDNPDPTATIGWGEQTTDEMMVCMFNVVFDAKFTTKQILRPEKPKAEPVKAASNN
jgi:hypothetical protein